MSVVTLKMRMPVDVRQKPKVKLRLRLIGMGGESDQFYKFSIAPMGVLAPGAHVCRVTFKHLPQPLRSHIRSSEP